MHTTRTHTRAHTHTHTTQPLLGGQSGHLAFEDTAHRNQNIIRRMLVEPELDNGEPLVLLAHIVLLAKTTH